MLSPAGQMTTSRRRCAAGWLFLKATVFLQAGDRPGLMAFGARPDGLVPVGLVKGLAYGATHPVDFAKAIVDWNTWAESPGRALGHLLPAVALSGCVRRSRGRG